MTPTFLETLVELLYDVSKNEFGTNEEAEEYLMEMTGCTPGEAKEATRLGPQWTRCGAN